MYELVLLANAILWLGIAFYYARLPIASVFHPVSYYLFFHGFIFTIRPIFAYLGDYQFVYRTYQFTPSMDDKITVLLAAMLGLVCFVAAALRTGSAPLRFAQDRCNDLEREQLIRPFLFVVALLAPMGLIAIIENWTTQANDASTMVFDAATGNSIHTSGTGYFTDLQLLLAPLAVMLIWLFRFRLWTFVPLAIFVVLRGGTGGRWPILMSCATVALMFLYQGRKRFPNIKATALVVVALSTFQLVGADRGATIRSQFITDNSFELVRTDRPDLGLLESMDFANLEYFEYIVYAVPQRSETYGYFLDNLQVFTEPIPRKFWTGKPVGPPIKLFSLFDYGFPIGMTYSLPGEGWMQLGYLGVAIWCSLFGLFYGWIYSKFQSSRQSTIAVFAFLLILPLSLQIFRDGLLLTLVKTHAWFLLPIAVTFGFARLAAVPLADDLRLRAYRRVVRRQPDIAAKIQARQRQGKRSIIGRTGWRTE